MNARYGINIIGAGTVGRALGEALARKGHAVAYVDTDPATVMRLRRDGMAAWSPEAVPSLAGDASLICVPTPALDGGGMDDRAIRDAARLLGRLLRSHPNYHLIVVKSTVLPGTTEATIIPLLERTSGKQARHDFGVCVSPEYLRSSSALLDAEHPRLALIGADDARAGEMLRDLYQEFDAPIISLGIRQAELQKYVHNLFNACKIAFFNEMRLLSAGLGIADTEPVFEAVGLSAEASWNPRYGARDLGPFDGDCLPKDAQALRCLAQEYGLQLQLLPAILEQNARYQSPRRHPCPGGEGAGG